MTSGQLENDDVQNEQGTSEYVTVLIDGQLFGISVPLVHDVFTPQSITKVPMSMPEVGGVLNLRGRIVTAIDMRQRLGLPPRVGDGPSMAIGIEHKGESYGLVIDSVGEVLRLSDSDFERNPPNLDSRWRSVSSGVQRLESELMIVLDVARVLDFSKRDAAA